MRQISVISWVFRALTLVLLPGLDSATSHAQEPLTERRIVSAPLGAIPQDGGLPTAHGRALQGFGAGGPMIGGRVASWQPTLPQRDPDPETNTMSGKKGSQDGGLFDSNTSTQVTDTQVVAMNQSIQPAQFYQPNNPQTPESLPPDLTARDANSQIDLTSWQRGLNWMRKNALWLGGLALILALMGGMAIRG